MKIYRGDLQHFDGPYAYQEALSDLGISDLGDPGTLIEVELDVHREGEDFLINGVVRAELMLSCDRCLCKTPLLVKGPFSVWLCPEIRPNLRTEEDEVLIFPPQQQELDLSRVISGTLYIELPPKTLCHEDCKGLCPTCGTDLNQRSCGCLNEVIDERWSALRALKKEKEIRE